VGQGVSWNTVIDCFAELGIHLSQHTGVPSQESKHLQQNSEEVQLKSLLSQPDFKERCYGDRLDTTPKRSSTVKVTEVSTPMQAYKHSTP
jgi:hypothetical protein